MAEYTFNIFLASPFNSGFVTTEGATFVYSGPATADGTAVITDNETGNDGLTLDDNVRGSQETATATVFDGTTTYTNIDVNADHGWTLYDPIDDVTFEVVAFVGKDGSNSFTFTLSEYPLVLGREYTVVQYDNQPNALVPGDPYFTYGDYVCFTRGARLMTPKGWQTVETLGVGDQVDTLDNGPQTIRWIGCRRILATGENAPISIAAGTLGNSRDIVVSPQHKMMVSDWQAELLFGTEEVLIPAKQMVDDMAIRRARGGVVEYFHVLLDNHEILNCEGTLTESFHPGDQAERILSASCRGEIFAALPRLAGAFANYGPSARPVLRAHEARLVRFDQGPQKAFNVAA